MSSRAGRRIATELARLRAERLIRDYGSARGPGPNPEPHLNRVRMCPVVDCLHPLNPDPRSPYHHTCPAHYEEEQS